MEWEGVMEKEPWLGAPITHGMCDLSFARHCHDGWVQVHFNTHYGIEESGGVPL